MSGLCSQEQLLQDAHDTAQKAMILAQATLDELRSYGEGGDKRGSYGPRFRNALAELQADSTAILQMLRIVKDGPPKT